MNRSGVFTITMLSLILAAVFFYNRNVTQENKIEALENSPAASVLSTDGSYVDIEGNPLSLNNYLGQPVIAFAWASWCPECGEQLKLLAEFERINKSTILAFNRAEPLSTAQSFLDYFSVSGDVLLVIDQGDSFFHSMGGYAMPELIMFDAFGNVAYHNRGPISVETLEREWSKLQ